MWGAMRNQHIEKQDLMNERNQLRIAGNGEEDPTENRRGRGLLYSKLPKTGRRIKAAMISRQTGQEEIVAMK